LAFDGSAYDGLSGQPGPRLLRPATHAVALASFPLFVLRLRQDVLQVSVPDAVDGPKILRATRPGFPGERWTMLFSDFEKCKRVAELVSTSLFVTESEDAVLARIAVYVAVEFP
jgi:hypothetical protein